MAGDIFYSNVDPHLVKELKARASAGFTKRSIDDLNYMFGKISNVEIRAYDGPKPTKSNLVLEENSNMSVVDPLAIIGGHYVREGSYLPSSTTSTMFESVEEGYLTEKGPRKAHRIPPVITLAEINIGDHSMGLLNTATINITIPDPTADFDNFERIWMRPGRHASVIIQCPDSAIITANKKEKLAEDVVEVADKFYTGGLLTDEALPSAKELAKTLGAAAIDKIRKDLKKMNYVRFDGVITSFQFTFQVDGTIECTITMTGTSNVYTDVSLLMPKSNPKDADDSTKVKTDNTEDNSIYSRLVHEINTEKVIDSHSQGNQESVQSIQIRPEGLIYKPPEEGTIEQLLVSQDRAILWGELYPQGKNDAKSKKGQQNQYTYVTLGYFVDFINNNIISKLTREKSIKGEQDPSVVEDPKVICNDGICRSRLYEFLVSADPSKILLSAGMGGDETNKYPNKTVILQPPQDPKLMGPPPPPETIQPIRYMPNDKSSEPFNDSKNDCSYPSRIFLGVETLLKEILEQDSVKTVNDLYKSISAAIRKYTGGAINMVLITHPTEVDKLLYYDSRYLGDTDEISHDDAFIIPMFAQGSPNNTSKNTSEIKGTIVYDAKISSKLPSSLKNLAYVLNQGSEISESEIAPFVSYMYADKKQKKKIKKNYKKVNVKNLKALENCKAVFTKSPLASANIERLREALVNYVKYPTDDITMSNKLSAPIYPFDVELTIEGINGFKYGDVVHIPALPIRYRDQTIFSIINVIQTVDSGGHWSTKIKLIMRPKIGQISP